MNTNIVELGTSSRIWNQIWIALAAETSSPLLGRLSPRLWRQSVRILNKGSSHRLTHRRQNVFGIDFADDYFELVIMCGIDRINVTF